MRFLRVVNESRHSVLGTRIRMADTLGSRLRGFLLRPKPTAGEGLFLAPCRGIHTYGMRFPLDILLIDDGGTVVAAHPLLEPGNRTPVYRHARFALELPSGAIAATGTLVGDRLSWAPAPAVTSNGNGLSARRPAVQSNGV
jgi:uncharacterized membrane protein (UPF0127 family)